PIPTKSGQVFYGWYDDNDNLIENGTWTGLEDLTLKAKWTTFNEYTNNGYTYIEYGKYPQKVVEDQDIISYISSNECTDKEGYLAYNGKQYARVNSAHPKGNYTSNSGNVTFEDGKTYYFEVEPITWRILENNSGKRLLFADKVLDVHNFDNDKRITNGIYPNNYKESSIREWLINTFYNKAFIGGDKQNIKATNVDNSTATVKNGGTNDYTCDNTNDKIFLLSYQDLINTTYGFSNDDSSNDDLLRTGYATDYALATGVCLNPDDNSSYYWTRSSDGASQNFNALPVVYYGILNRPLDVTTAHVGVRPAITIEF
ncbi:MAG: hypothetical protein HUJ61_03655, partial [Bacilli bacterium]|nr:hypothetical protein [Bacilli bacterium]